MDAYILHIRLERSHWYVWPNSIIQPSSPPETHPKPNTNIVAYSTFPPPYLHHLLRLCSSPSPTPSLTSSSTPPNTTPTPTTPYSPSSSSLDPNQLRALQSLNIPTSKDSALPPPPIHKNKKTKKNP
ncbi:hypothetical protein ACE6H2_006204 [Prunus campanulata]